LHNKKVPSLQLHDPKVHDMQFRKKITYRVAKTIWFASKR